MSKYNLSLGCEWYDLKVGKKLPKPFAITTVATKDLIETLAQEYDTILEVYNNINYDEDAKKVLEHLINKGYDKYMLKEVL